MVMSHLLLKQPVGIKNILNNLAGCQEYTVQYVHVAAVVVVILYYIVLGRGQTLADCNNLMIINLLI